MSARRGLPRAVKMRHDVHYVDSLVFKEGEVVGRMVPMQQVQPNPEQPRREMGDLEGLIQSIKQHGVLEPILVQKNDENYQIISGERRWRAAKKAGLEQIPCILKDLSDQEILEVALIENLQRKDLNPFEEADGLKTLVDRYDYTHEEVSKKIGKSRSSVTETLTICKIDPDVRQIIFEAEIHAKSLILSIAKCANKEEQVALIMKIKRGAGREEVRKETKKGSRPKPYVFRFKDPEKSFRFDIRFKRSSVTRYELIESLEKVLQELKATTNGEDLG